MESITREEIFLAKIIGETVPDIEPIVRKEMFLARIAGMDIPAIEPITREEMFLNAIANGETVSIKPFTRRELYYAKALGMDVVAPDPITRKEVLLSQLSQSEPSEPVEKYSWEGVFASIKKGTYATDYAIGDMIPLDLGSEGLINMQIAAFDTDDLADGSGKAPITWISKEILETDKRMNTAYVEIYDYKKQDASTSWYNNSNINANTNKTVNFRTYIQAGELAEITNTIEPTADGTLTITYKGLDASYGSLEVLVNGGTIVTDYVSTTSATYTVELVSGNTVTVVAKFTSAQISSSSAYVAFESTGTFNLTATSNQVVSRYVSGFEEGKGAVGGWEKTEMRSYLKETVKPLIPDIVRNAIKEVTKVQQSYNGESFTTMPGTTVDDIWLPDENEVDISSGSYKSIFPDKASRAKSKVGTTSTTDWWLRTGYNYNSFKTMNDYGNVTFKNTTNSCGVVICFCT